MTPIIDQTHEPSLRSWVSSANGHGDFPIQNLPYGIFTPPGGSPRAGVAIGSKILDLKAVGEAGWFAGVAIDGLQMPTLNALLDAPSKDRLALRRHLSGLLSDDVHQAKIEPFLHDADTCVLHLPAAIGDYTDFYVGIHHANNVGRQFRPDNPLLPNYKYVPIGYHGRASSVRPSGISVMRPQGQTKPPEAAAPSFGPSKRLDFELEMGVWVGHGNPLGEPIPIEDAPSHIAGLCLLNDWSARDIQAWEYQPLGPFLSKNFQTTISPWIVTTEALAPFRIAQPARPQGDPRPLDYLWAEADQQQGALAIDLEVLLTTSAMRDSGLAPHRLSQGPASNMYWTIAQIVTHHASGGCNFNPGDLIGTGTISAPHEGGFGSLLEITRGGAQPILLPNGETRTFLEDGDEIILAGKAHAQGYTSIGFGQCRAIVTPSPCR